jgi:hypothetical protein
MCFSGRCSSLFGGARGGGLQGAGEGDHAGLGYQVYLGQKCAPLAGAGGRTPECPTSLSF